jgi:positive regulator of sigma E activity
VLFIQSQQSQQIVVKSSNGEMTVTPVRLSIKEKMINVPHFVQTFLHLVQVFISYILMLIVMLCNLWLIIAICLGAAIGYFAFGWLRKLSFKDTTECCYWKQISYQLRCKTCWSDFQISYHNVFEIFSTTKIKFNFQVAHDEFLLEIFGKNKDFK